MEQQNVSSIEPVAGPEHPIGSTCALHTSYTTKRNHPSTRLQISQVVGEPAQVNDIIQRHSAN